MCKFEIEKLYRDLVSGVISTNSVSIATEGIWKEEGFTRRWPDVMEMEGEIVKRAEALLDRFNK